MYINVKFLSNLIPFNAITAIAVSGQNFRSVHIAIADLSNTESDILCNIMEYSSWISKFLRIQILIRVNTICNDNTPKINCHVCPKVSLIM